jgi:predicted amidohydrolase
VRAAFVQFEPAYLDVAANTARAEALLADADADLVVLPELFTSGYFFASTDDVRAVAEPIPGPTTDRLAAYARRTGATVVAGLPERAADGRLFNSAAVVQPSGTVTPYRKVHLYFEETTHFAPGDLGFPVVDAVARDGSGYRLGVMICFDWYYPEAARTLALAGADVIAHPANLVRPDCPRAMPIRALENHVFTITANRTGAETQGDRTLAFIGQSTICDPDGAVLAQAGRAEAAVGAATFDPAAARARRLTPHNDLLADRRPAQYRLA